MRKLLNEWREYLAEQESVAADPAIALVEKYWGIAAGKQMKPSREELMRLKQIAKKSAPAAKILAMYYKPANRNMYSYWRKHYEKLSKTSLGRGKIHDVAKRADAAWAHPKFKAALLDAIDKGANVATIGAIATGVGIPAGLAIKAATKMILQQGFKQLSKKIGEKAAMKALAKHAAHHGAHTGAHLGAESEIVTFTKRAVQR